MNRSRLLAVAATAAVAALGASVAPSSAAEPDPVETNLRIQNDNFADIPPSYSAKWAGMPGRVFVFADNDLLGGTVTVGAAAKGSTTPFTLGTAAGPTTPCADRAEEPEYECNFYLEGLQQIAPVRDEDGNYLEFFTAPKAGTYTLYGGYEPGDDGNGTSVAYGKAVADGTTQKMITKQVPSKSTSVTLPSSGSAPATTSQSFKVTLQVVKPTQAGLPFDDPYVGRTLEVAGPSVKIIWVPAAGAKQTIGTGSLDLYNDKKDRFTGDIDVEMPGTKGKGSIKVVVSGNDATTGSSVVKPFKVTAAPIS